MDLLQFEKDIPEEVNLIRNNISRLVAEEKLIPKMNEWYDDEIFPKDEILKMLRKADLICLDTIVDETYGCVKVSYLDYGLVSKAIEAIDSGLRSFLPSVIKGLVRFPIHEFGSPQQKEKYLPLLSCGLVVGCFGLTGPPGGSNPQDMIMRAVPDGDYFILNGEKNWITNGSIADFAIVWAKLHDNPSSIRAFIVEKGTPGFSQEKIRHKRGLRVSDTGNLIFQDCRVHKSAMLPHATGMGSVYQCLNQARFSIGWGVIGAAEECFMEAKRFAQEREVMDSNFNMKTKLKNMQAIKGYFAEMGSYITYMNAAAWRAAELVDRQGGITRNLAETISFIKLQTRFAREVAELAGRIVASNGLQYEGTSCIARHQDNLKIVDIYEGTREIHLYEVLGKYFTQ